MSPPTPGPRRREPSLVRQAAEGIGTVAVMALATLLFGFLVAVVVSWIF